MHLLAEMGDETSGRHWRSTLFGIEFWSRADPPGALQHDDVTVVGMEVRPAEMVALGPFGVDGIEAGLGRVAYNDGVLRAASVDRAPRNLVRQLVDHRGWIEFCRRTDAKHAGKAYRHRHVSPKPVCGLHDFLQ